MISLRSEIGNPVSNLLAPDQPATTMLAHGKLAIIVLAHGKLAIKLLAPNSLIPSLLPQTCRRMCLPFQAMNPPDGVHK